MARQHGVLSRVQARDSGLSDHQIRSLIETGRWLIVDANVFASGSSPSTWRRRMGAAVLSRPTALVAGRSAAYLHSFPGFPTTRPEILVPFPGNARSVIARVIRSRHFDLISRTVIDGLEATTAAETILTLSMRETPATIERVVDDSLASRRLTVADFDPILERLEHARMRGLPTLRRIVAMRDDAAYQAPTSELERLLYRLLDSDELPVYDRQVPIKYPTAAATVDAFIPAWRVIVEADGRRWHTRRDDFERDRSRDNSAATAGLIVVRFTYHMLKNQRDHCRQVLLETGSWRAAS